MGTNHETDELEKESTDESLEDKEKIEEDSNPVKPNEGKSSSILEKILTHQSTSSYDALKNRKVEPLKINLNREPIKTVIKIPPIQENQQHSPKIVIKPLKPCPEVQSNLEHEIDNGSSEDGGNSQMEQQQIVPKIKIRNIFHSNLSSSLTTSNDNSVGSSSPENFQGIIPKLTIKIDHQNSQDFHAKVENHQSLKIQDKRERNKQDDCMLTNEGVKLTIKPIPEPPIPKLTIKTNSTECVGLSSNKCLASPVSKIHVKQHDLSLDHNEDKSNEVKATNPINEVESGVASPTVPKLILKVGGNKIVCRDEFTHSSKEIHEKSISEPDPSSDESNKPESLSANEPESYCLSSKLPDDELPDSPRIIIKINKTATISNELKMNVQTCVTSPALSKLNDSFKNDDENKSFDDNNDEVLEGERNSTNKRLREIDTIDSDEDSVKKQKLNLKDDSKTSDLDVNTEFITIDDDSSSMEKTKSSETLSELNVDVKNNIEVTINNENKSELTPKRGRGRPKKVLPAASSKISTEEIDLDNKAKVEENNLNDTSVTEQKNENTLDANKTTPKGRKRGRIRGGKTVVNVVKDGKIMKVKMDAGYEDDDSPTFSIYNRYANNKGRGRGGRGKRNMIKIKKSNFNENLEGSFDSNKSNNTATDLKISLQKLPIKGDQLQIFEEDAMMGGDLFQMPFSRNISDFQDESQSSQLSNASATNEGRERKRGKMEVCEPEGRTEFTVDMLAEYEWPPSKPGQKSRSETYMIQEQISEYLGIKSFKRKYPDLMRRPVEMEERNFMMERGLVSEKMCDLGLTAVAASEILDIMCNDYPEKYEEYRRYQREKQFLEISHRQKLLRFEQENKGQLQKDRAIETTASWNAMFNKERLQSRKKCIDLQTLIVHIPKGKSEKPNGNSSCIPSKTHYPISLVPGQFSEFFKQYTAEELACYPVNTVLIHHSKLGALLKKRDEILNDKSSDSEYSIDDSSCSSNSSFSDSSSTSSSDSEQNDDESDPLCAVCDLTMYKNTYGQPEIFIECTSCHRKAHPTCIKMPMKMVKRAMEYNWQCAECKSCYKCLRSIDESKMLFCVQCDRGYHIYCLGLRNIPEGQWYCNICTICTKCGSKTPEGHFSNLMVANWTHLYRTNNITKLREHYQTLCNKCKP